GLEAGDDLWVRGRPDAGTDQVVRRLDVRDPVADCLACRFLERLRAEFDRPHLGAEQAHPFDVWCLSPHVLDSHVDHTVEAEPRARRGGGAPAWAGPRPRAYPLLPEPLGEPRLAQSVVELVRAGMEQILALQVEPLARGEPLDERQGGGAAAVIPAELFQLGVELRISGGLRPAALKFFECWDQRFGHVASAVGPVQAFPRRLRSIFRGSHRAASTKARTRS